MYGEVEGDDDPGHARLAAELSKAQGSSSGVVVDMEEEKGLLLEDKEDGIGKLPVLEVVVGKVV